MHFEELVSGMNAAICLFRRIPEVELHAVTARRGRSRRLGNEGCQGIELDLSDFLLRRDVKGGSARKLRIAATIPVPMQPNATKIGPLSHVQQSGRLAGVEHALPEHRGLPRDNDSVVASGSVVQR